VGYSWDFEQAADNLPHFYLVTDKIVISKHGRTIAGYFQVHRDITLGEGSV